ncbi:unnamed protein product [Closterium sp. Naga37s-1]|nr:unnamed protein product [Closterium sp. Naga37s-1]
MQLLLNRRHVGKTLANPDHAPLPAEDVKHEVGLDVPVPTPRCLGLRSRLTGLNVPPLLVIRRIRIARPRGGAGREARDCASADSTVGGGARGRGWGEADADSGTDARAGTFEGTTRRDRTTAAGRIAETALAEAFEEAARIPEERAIGDAGRRPAAGEEEEGEAVDDDKRNHHGPSDEGGYAREESDPQIRGVEKGSQLLRAQPGQRRLRAGLARACPGPLAGWEQQTTPPRAPTVAGDDVCPSSTRRRETQEEEEGERRAEELAGDDGYEEEVALAASAAERQRRAGKIRQKALQERVDEQAAGQQPQNAAARAATRGRGRGRAGAGAWVSWWKGEGQIWKLAGKAREAGGKWG